jgi:hypothetical protein
MPTSHARSAGIASLLGSTFVLLGVGIAGGGAMTVATWMWRIVMGAWLVVRPAPSPVEG